MVQQDTYVYQQIGLGIVGIGALLWAYGQVNEFILREIIAFIGLGGSLILWMNIFGCGREWNEAEKELKKRNPNFFEKFDNVHSWRYQGKYQYLYTPVTRLMTYFMGLVSWAWLIILIHLLQLVSIEYLSWMSAVVIIGTLALLGYRRYKDVIRYLIRTKHN